MQCLFWEKGEKNMQIVEQLHHQIMKKNLQKLSFKDVFESVVQLEDN